MYCILFYKLKIHKCGCHSIKCKIKNSTENWNIPQLRKNNKYGRKPRRTSKGNSKKMWHNKQGINTTGAKNQVGKDKIRVKLKLFDTCLMTALVYGMEAWGSIKLMEMREIENIQGKTLERIFQLPVSTTYTGIIRETGIWPAEQNIQYATMMLYHNIKNSDDNRKVKTSTGTTRTKSI